MDTKLVAVWKELNVYYKKTGIFAKLVVWVIEKSSQHRIKMRCTFDFKVDGEVPEAHTR